MLHEPEIPFNAGVAGKTCVVTNTALHLIRPYGFFLGNKYLKCAGMDYWQKLSLCEYDNCAAFLAQHPGLGLGQRETSRKLWFATTKAEQTYVDVSFGPDDCTMLDKESVGVPEGILAKHKEACIRIPIWGDVRSLSLPNAVAVVLYEALRQQDLAKLGK